MTNKNEPRTDRRIHPNLAQRSTQNGHHHLNQDQMPSQEIAIESSASVAPWAVGGGSVISPEVGRGDPSHVVGVHVT
jgi:hypothetical protein